MSNIWDSVFFQGAAWKLILALILGAMIGLEREWHGRAAGLRTHVLVCLGSTILLIAAHEASKMMLEVGGPGNVVMDPNRISAGIVTGIGFLGGGAIIRMGDLIRGLTTAACIWFVAALGIVIGNGLYTMAIFSTLAVLLVLIVFDMFEHYIPAVIYRSLTISIDPATRDDFEDWCAQQLSSKGLRIQECLSYVDLEKQQAVITFRVRLRGRLKQGLMIDRIAGQPGVQSVGWGHDKRDLQRSRPWD